LKCNENSLIHLKGKPAGRGCSKPSVVGTRGWGTPGCPTSPDPTQAQQQGWHPALRLASQRRDAQGKQDRQEARDLFAALQEPTGGKGSKNLTYHIAASVHLGKSIPAWERRSSLPSPALCLPITSAPAPSAPPPPNFTFPPFPLVPTAPQVTPPCPSASCAVLTQSSPQLRSCLGARLSLPFIYFHFIYLISFHFPIYFES